MGPGSAILLGVIIAFFVIGFLVTVIPYIIVLSPGVLFIGFCMLLDGLAKGDQSLTNAGIFVMIIGAIGSVVFWLVMRD